MPGKTVLIKSDGQVVVEWHDRMPSLERMQSMVLGYIQIVPMFDKILLPVGDVSYERCITLCNEDGKVEGLPINISATRLWYEARPDQVIDDILVGDVLLITGDEEFLGQF